MMEIENIWIRLVNWPLVFRSIERTRDIPSSVGNVTCIENCPLDKLDFSYLNVEIEVEIPVYILSILKLIIDNSVLIYL